MRRLCVFVAILATLCASAVGHAQTGQVVGSDPRFGPVCAGPLGPGPCAEVDRYLSMQRQGPTLTSPGAPPLQQIGFLPGVGPICAGPLGPGPCAAVQQYLLSMTDNAPQTPVITAQDLRVVNNVPGVGPVCQGPAGVVPCAQIQQQRLDAFTGPLPPQASFGVPAELKAEQLGQHCAAKVGLDSILFAACTGQQVVLPTDLHQVLDCAVGSRETEQFAECAATPLGVRLSDDQWTTLTCASKSGGNQDEFVKCARPAFLEKKLSEAQRQILECAAKSNGETDKFVGCAAPALLGRNGSREQRVAMQCAAVSGGAVNAFAACTGANMINLQLNPEQQIAVQCIVSTGGQPYVAAGCMATRLTARELLKCAANGIGGKDGCFGDNNDPVGKNGWVARTFGQIAGAPNSVIDNPGQIWGGDNSFVRNPSQIWGGDNSSVRNPSLVWGGGNSSVRNPSQIWGEANSVFNNPRQLLQSPKPLTVSSSGKRLCMPWCPSSDVQTSVTKDDSGNTFPVWYGTNRQPVAVADESKGYASNRDRTIHYGKVLVNIPKGHRFGSTGSKWYMRVFNGDDPISVRAIIPFGEREFLVDLRSVLSKSEQGILLIYIHGYNVSFQDAAIRAAQIGYDLGINGATAFYSWPSRGELKGYGADVASVEASEESLATFVATMAKVSEAKRVHIVAHSMGNLGLIRALNRATTQASLAGVKFGQIFLAAPDVDADLFKQLAVAYPKISQRTTLYVSNRDKALEASYWLRDFARAGYTPPITAVKDIDTVEVTNIDLSTLGHGYFAEASDVLRDMYDLMMHNEPPDKRIRLQRSVTQEGYHYWSFKP